MTYEARPATGLLLIAAAACSATGSLNEPTPETDDPQGQIEDQVDAAVRADAPLEVSVDAERPLVCGDAGFCETRLPRSDLGTPFSLRSVWEVGSNDVWSVTVQGTILHYDGTIWNVEYRANHELYSVWATSTSVWVGGEAGLLLHRSDRGEWSRVEAHHVAPIRAIYGGNDSDVWFARQDASVDHFDGVELKNISIAVRGLRITSVFGDPNSGAYAAGYVEGALLPTQVYDDRAYVLSLSNDTISLFNASLPERTGFVPITGAVVDSSDRGRGVLLIGYEAHQLDGDSLAERQLKWGIANGIDPVDLVSLGDYALNVDEVAGGIPVLACGWDDIWILRSMSKILDWDGSQFLLRSLAMGYDVAPARVLAAHCGSEESWIVGEGFALKGRRP